MRPGQCCINPDGFLECWVWPVLAVAPEETAPGPFRGDSIKPTTPALQACIWVSAMWCEKPCHPKTAGHYLRVLTVGFCSGHSPSHIGQVQVLLNLQQNLPEEAQALLFKLLTLLKHLLHVLHVLGCGLIKLLQGLLILVLGLCSKCHRQRFVSTSLLFIAYAL